MVAAGRGVFVGSETAIRGREEIWTTAGDYYLLTEPGSHFELFAIRKKQPHLEPTISKFVDFLVAELKSP